MLHVSNVYQYGALKYKLINLISNCFNQIVYNLDDWVINNMNIKYIGIISGVILLLAMFNFWPYVFYILLRWFVCGASIYFAYFFNQKKLKGWLFIFLAIAFIFNPIIPVYSIKSSWMIIDFVSSILFFIASYPSKNEKK